MNTTKPSKPKLRIDWDPKGRWYVCHDDHFIRGYGHTPLEAYADWTTKDARRTVIARRGVWEQRSCRQWARRGCPPLRTYIGGKQIYGYLWEQDLLLLRG